MGKRRRIIAPYWFPELRTEPATPSGLELIDEVGQAIVAPVGLRGTQLRFLKVDERDRLLICPRGDEANRITWTQILAVPPAWTTVVFTPEMVGWTIQCRGGGLEVDPEDPAGVSLGLFGIAQAGTWKMNIPCAQVLARLGCMTGPPAVAATIIEWRRV